MYLPSKIRRVCGQQVHRGTQRFPRVDDMSRVLPVSPVSSSSVVPSIASALLVQASLEFTYKAC
jgi:hypothetical protein